MVHEKNVCSENNPSLGQTPQEGAESHPWMQQAEVLIMSPRLLPHKTSGPLRPLQPGLVYDSRISYSIHELQKLGLRKLVLPPYHHWEPALSRAQKEKKKWILQGFGLAKLWNAAGQGLSGNENTQVLKEKQNKHCPKPSILKPFQNRKQDKNVHLDSAGTGNTRTHSISSLQQQRIFIPVLTDPSCVVKSLEQSFFLQHSTIKFHWRLCSAQQFQTTLKVRFAHHLIYKTAKTGEFTTLLKSTSMLCCQGQALQEESIYPRSSRIHGKLTKPGITCFKRYKQRHL